MTMDTKAYERCKKEIAKMCKTTYFTKDFFKTFEKDRALHCLCRENFENVRKTDFYQKNGTAYDQFLKAYERERPLLRMRVVLFVPAGEQYGMFVSIGKGTYEDLHTDEWIKTTLISLLSLNHIQEAVRSNCRIADTFRVSVGNPHLGTKEDFFYTADELMYLLDRKPEIIAKHKAMIEEHFSKKRRRSIDRE